MMSSCVGRWTSFAKPNFSTDDILAGMIEGEGQGGGGGGGGAGRMGLPNPNY